MVSDDIYDALAPLGAAGVYDTKLPDGYSLSGGDVLIVFSSISEIPDKPIGGQIAASDERWQVSIRSLDLTAARTMKRAVVTALHNLRTSSIKYCEFESAPGELLEEGPSEPQYHIPVDFMILS